jgi:hypothetical protein
MKFQTPYNASISSSSSSSLRNPENFISSKIKFATNQDNYHKVISITKIPKNEIILVELPCATLYGEPNIDRGLQTLQKYLLLGTQNHIGITTLYPRDKDIYTFPRTTLIKQIHKIIKNIPDKHHKLREFFNQYTKTEIEFYYAKYIFNAFEGFEYGPLTLPYLAKFNHSCNSNIIFNFDKTNGTMIVKTTKNIQPGEELFNSYLFNKTIPNHKEYLYEHYGFTSDCNCKVILE